ncbi:MAG: periplasmic heavy metal sensor, partial [Deltaproteobacteria bacterium]|nr:periplasmic heavy metal sensor [Deltaproteobacteria bacterium]
MKKVMLLLSVVAILMLAAAPAALACGHPGHAGKEVGMISCMTEKLGLSADQQKKVDEIKKSMLKKVAPDMAKLSAMKGEMMKLWQAAKPSRKAILAKQAKIQKVMLKLGTLKVDAHLKLLKILNADQKKRLGEQMKAHHKVGGCPGGCPEGCTCPACKAKAAGDKPAKKKHDCKGCPGDCKH